jgi:hypothetical protein
MANQEPPDKIITFNGINARTGRYGLPPMTGKELAEFICGEKKPANLKELEARDRSLKAKTLGLKAGLDPKKLSDAGWAVIFAHDADPALKEALQPLIRLREAQVGSHRFHVYEGPDGFRRGVDDKGKWLARKFVGHGPADPDKVPYYLLIAGGPEDIPYRFQNELDLQYAVGRIHFDSLDEYANYAASVVACEQGKVKLARRAAFWSTANPDDDATALSTELLMEPLCQTFTGQAPGWQVDRFMRDAARKANLRTLMGGPAKPALLMTASHGMEFPQGDPCQVSGQGALLCQDWGGPSSVFDAPLSPSMYFSAEDVPADANLLGMIAFVFACYGAGTPQLDEFSQAAFKERMPIADKPFVAALPKRMLGHPNGGALAVVGHIERAWSFSFMSPEAGPQRTVFEDLLKNLLDGYPIGYAVEPFNNTWAEQAAMLNNKLEDISFGAAYDPYELADMWTSNNDARGYAIIGDPAVRVPLQVADGAQERPTIRK